MANLFAGHNYVGRTAAGLVAAETNCKLHASGASVGKPLKVSACELAGHVVDFRFVVHVVRIAPGPETRKITKVIIS